MEKERRSENLALIGLIVLFLLGLFALNRTPQVVHEDDYYSGRPDIEADNVVIGRAYLDGVQENTVGGVSVVGLKYVNGLPIEQAVLDKADIYDIACQIVNEDWRPLVDSLVHHPLSDNERDILVLTAMRMGPTRFANSTLLRKVNEGDFAGATNCFILENNGQPMEMGLEAKQYFCILRSLWDGQLSFKELMWLPMFSYRQLSAAEAESDILMEDAWYKLESGDNPVPVDALNLL